MRLPALLFAKTAKARIAQTVRPGQPSHLVEYVNCADVLHLGSEHPVAHEKIREIVASSERIVWVGGGEPLEHPGIAHLVRALASSGHYVFLETNGVLLRCRIHEFQPLPRVFLTVRLDPRRKSEFDLAIEGLRAAHLSGFFTVVHSIVGESSDVSGFDELRALLLGLDLDGWMITARSADQSALALAAEARKQIPSAGWRWFSTRVECTLLGQAKGSELQGVSVMDKPRNDACEESVKVA